MLVCGDFNARTGGLSDQITSSYQISHDSVRVSFEHPSVLLFCFSDCPLPQNYIPDQTKSRNQLDTKSNLHGKLLTDICKSHNLRILNGRFLGDSLGYFTFFNSNGCSTVDYMLASNEIFHQTEYFSVSSPSELSYHSLIHVSIRMKKTDLSKATKTY